jgi:acylphosphatase
MFRATAADQARDLGIGGYALNLPDRSVEIVAEGKVENLRMFAAWAHLGPFGARVTGVDEDWSDYGGEFTGFAVR